MSKKFTEQSFENIEIIDISSEGLGVAKIDNWVVFVEGAVPGDICNITIYRKKKSFGFARITHLIKHSPHRVEAPCTHFGTCGGCKWQNFSYAAQLEYKQNQVVNAFQRIAKVEVAQTFDILGCKETYYYRNKLDFGFSDKKWLTAEEIKNTHLPSSQGEETPFPLERDGDRSGCGFHISGAFDKVLDITHCHLQASPSNEIRNEVKRFALANNYTFFNIREKAGLLRTMMIRTSSTGEVMCVISFFDNDEEKINALLSHVKESFPQITSLLYVINQKGNDTIYDLPVHCFSGNTFIYEEMEGLKFKIGAKSFYQTNSAQAYQLYKITRDFANLQGNELVYDLYTGTGTIALFVAKTAKQVVGIESVPEAIEDAKENARINNATNTAFYAGDMKDVLNDDFIAFNGKPDVIITDPPRMGMHPAVVAKLLELAAPKIVYVSCNPASQARDIALLATQYKVSKVQAVDMFPQTLHVECVALLELR
ncbi:MAG: 23S rRNA (uracil(1939)-C(5))-methyltransferase RlmD [Bacteroidia bacterium]